MRRNEYDKILETLKNIVENSEFEGHVFSVGGCERDKILHRDIKDIDLVVDLNDGGIRFAKWLEANGFTTGSVVVYERFGTAMFRLSEFPDIELEVVQTRCETYNDSNSRKPMTGYGTINDDCIRRDFTINSLYHNISTGDGLDLTARGIEDLQNELIRTCGKPDDIFKDDPLRILRALRFSVQLNFGIDVDTQTGMSKNAFRLSIISKERIQSELNKIFESEKPYYALWTMTLLDISKEIFPTLTSSDIFDYTSYLIKAREIGVNINDKVTLCWILLGLSVGLETVKELMFDLKYPNKTIQKTEKYTKLVREYLNGIQHNKFEYDCGDQNSYRDVSEILRVFDVIVKPHKRLMCGYKLPVNGNDVMKYAGISEGKEVKGVLNDFLSLAFKRPHITRFELILRLILKRFFN